MALLHAAALWALHAGLQRPSGEAPVAMMRVTDVSPPMPAPQAQTPAARQIDAGPAPARADVVPAAARTAALRAPAPADAPASGGTPPMAAPAAAPVSGDLPSALAPASPAAVAATGSGPGANPGAGSLAGGSTTGAAPSRVEGPSSEAVHLRNPKPTYPIQSRRLGEQGKVVLRVLVDPDGAPQKAQVHQSSGHDRLDQAALATALAWRYVPGRRGGVPEAMWLDVPIQFVLE